MKRQIVIVVGCLLALTAVMAGDKSDVGTMRDQPGLAFGRSSAAEILDGAYQQIQWYEARELDVPLELYNFYFKFEQLVHPEFYEGRHAGAVVLDEFTDSCPGGIIDGPTSGSLEVVSCGQTNNALNDCTYPNCRYGKDIVVQLEVHGFDYVEVVTTGSMFDTYLCLYEDGCCGEIGSSLVTSNNNNPTLCQGQRLAAGFATCLDPGTYWLVLDGAGVAARGSYCLTVFFDFDNCGG